MAAGLTVLALLAVPLVGGGSIAAQAREVLVTVTPSPARPAAGGDVVASVVVDGCPPGEATVQMYRNTSDGVGQENTLISTDTVTVDLLWRARAEVRIAAAVAGWYGPRVVCGLFRPERAPLPNARFAVGLDWRPPFTLSSTQVSLGGTVRLLGQACPGNRVDYAVTQTGGRITPFTATGTVPTSPDGSWGADVTLGPPLQPGPVDVRARCVVASPFGEPMNVYYPSSVAAQILGS